MTARTANGGPARLTALLVLVLLTAGCVRGCRSGRPPIHPNPNMDNQEKVLPQSESDFFYDGASMRPPVPGTVARGELRADPAFHEGRDAGGAFVAAAPLAVDERLLARGAERYEIYCTPCHDSAGAGNGILTQRAAVPVANLLLQKYKDYPDGQMFDVITNGLGLMKGYRYPISTTDRWAIVAHVRELQRMSGDDAAAVTE